MAHTRLHILVFRVEVCLLHVMCVLQAGLEVQVWVNGMDSGLHSQHTGLGRITVAARPMAMLSQASSHYRGILAVSDLTKLHPHPTKKPRLLPPLL